MAAEQSDLVDAILAAPVGVALLGRLEARHRYDPPERPLPPGSQRGVAVLRSSSAAPHVPLKRLWEVPVDSEPAAVAAAAAEVGAISFGQLLAIAVETGRTSAGPWMSTATVELASAYGDANHRRSIAEAIVTRFADELEAPIGLATQEWWYDNHLAARGVAPEELFRNYERVYGNGEFTWAALRTSSGPPPEVHGEMVAAWEMDSYGPVSRWRLPAAKHARVWEIARPEDWVRLVERYPKAAHSPHSGWELPGPNQRIAPELLEQPNQHAARGTLDRHVLPDWSAVAQEWDGVHLSWAGWLTGEGFVSDLPTGGVTMLRYWDCERTFWLRDVFGEPTPLTAPHIDTEVVDLVIDVTTNDARRASDREVIRVMLGR